MTCPHLKWFAVVGLDQLPHEVYFQRSSELNFRKSELRALARLWGLEERPLSRFVAHPVDTGQVEEDEPVARPVHGSHGPRACRRGATARGALRRLRVSRAGL